MFLHHRRLHQLRKIEKKVLEVTKSNADDLRRQSGVEPSLLTDEAKRYLHEVLEDVKKRKKTGSLNGNHNKD